MTERGAFKAIDPAYYARLHDVLAHMGSAQFRGTTFSDFQIDVVWPLRGALRFTRDLDGQRFALVLIRGRWDARPVK